MTASACKTCGRHLPDGHDYCTARCHQVATISLANTKGLLESAQMRVTVAQKAIDNVAEMQRTAKAELAAAKTDAAAHTAAIESLHADLSDPSIAVR